MNLNPSSHPIVNGQDPVARAFNLCLEELRPGYARVSMTVDERCLNHHGAGHGGITFLLADAAFAYACNSRDIPTVGAHCSITYCAPTALGDILTATAQEQALAGRNGVYDVSVINQCGDIIALFRGNSIALKKND